MFSVGIFMVSGDFIPEYLGSNYVAVPACRFVLHVGDATHRAVWVLWFMNQQVRPALGFRLQVSVCRLSVAINAVVDVKWNHVVGISVRKCKERWGWNAVVANRGAQSPAASIIAIDVWW